MGKTLVKIFGFILALIGTISVVKETLKCVEKDKILASCYQSSSFYIFVIGGFIIALIGAIIFFRHERD